MIQEKESFNIPEKILAERGECRRSRELPEKPLIRIKPSATWDAIDLAGLWSHRELLYFLVWRDLKARYKQTILGGAWVILQPVLMTIVFTLFLGRIVQVPSGNIPYPLFVYAALLPWIFFSNAVTSGSISLIANTNLITKVFFPRLIVPAAAVGVRLADFIVACATLIVPMVYFGARPGWSIVMFPILMLNLTLLALSLSILFSALNVRYRDIGTVLPVVLQLLMFASPVLYPASLVPNRFKWIYELNPLSGTLEGLRASLIGLELNTSSIAISAAITITLLVCAVYLFGRMQEDFADII